jgi:hypothetical protein
MLSPIHSTMTEMAFVTYIVGLVLGFVLGVLAGVVIT